MPSDESIASIALALPEKPTSGDILTALARAERVGYERALVQAAQRNADTADQLPAILRRQAT